MITMGAIVFGILLLLAGGTALVHGASQLATRFGVSPMVVGLTVVAFGTSMPELVVNLVGASRGFTELAFGNVIGSNVANLALVLGAAALIRPIDIHGQLVQRELPLLLLAMAILTVLALDTVFDGTQQEIGRGDAIILLLVFCIFLYITVMDFLRSRKSDTLLQDIDSNPLVATHRQTRLGPMFVLLGLVLLYFGGEMTVRHSVVLAESLGVSTAIVGLCVVAIGTSMPELVTSIVAAFRNESDLALGNIVGSNLFNTLFVLPSSALVKSLRIPEGGITDLLFSLVLALSLIPIFVFGRARLGRLTGAAFMFAYGGWVAYRITG